MRVRRVDPLGRRVVDRRGAAGPDGGHTDRPVPEARPAQVEAGVTDRRPGLELDVEARPPSAGRRKRCAAPAVGVDGDAVAERHGEELLDLAGRACVDEGDVEDGRTAAERQLAAEVPAARSLRGHELAPAEPRGPHAGQRAGRQGAAGLGDDRHGVAVGLGETGDRQVLGRRQPGAARSNRAAVSPPAGSGRSRAPSASSWRSRPIASRRASHRLTERAQVGGETVGCATDRAGRW